MKKAQRVVRIVFEFDEAHVVDLSRLVKITPPDKGTFWTVHQQLGLRDGLQFFVEPLVEYDGAGESETKHQ